MPSDNDRALARESYLLEGYKDLSKWSDRDEQSLISRDKFLLTASVGACVASLTKYQDAYHFVYLGSLVALSYWMILSFRYRIRIGARFRAMLGIERELGFSAHSVVVARYSDDSTFRMTILIFSRELSLRISFYILFLVVMCPPVVNWMRGIQLTTHLRAF